MFIKNIFKLRIQLNQLINALLNIFTVLPDLLKQDFLDCILKVSLCMVNMIHLAVEAEIAIALLAVSSYPLVLMTLANKYSPHDLWLFL